METCYKIMRGDVARSLELTADRFDIEPEITARLLVAGHTIDERPVTFTPRSRAAGKKIGWRDGLVAVRVLLRLRPRGRVPDPRAAAPRARHACWPRSAIVVSGGFEFRIAGVLVRAHSPAIAIGVALGAIVLAATRGRAQIAAASTWWWKAIDRGAPPMACAVAIAAIATGWVWGTHVAGGSDSYCYLNEAELLAGGHARQLQPDAANIPWPDSRWAFVPAGHAPAPGPDGAVVPICPSGISTHDGGRAHDRRPRRHVLDRPADGRPGRVAGVRARPAHRRSAGGFDGGRAARVEPGFSLPDRAADERRPGDGALAAGAGARIACRRAS